MHIEKYTIAEFNNNNNNNNNNDKNNDKNNNNNRMPNSMSSPWEVQEFDLKCKHLAAVW